jgi:hypothetical protein
MKVGFDCLSASSVVTPPYTLGLLLWSHVQQYHTIETASKLFETQPICAPKNQFWVYTIA